MILVTRLDRQSMYLNPDHIISVEETPDTVITLFNGHHILVREKSQTILNRIVAFRTKLIRRSGAVHNGHAYLRRQRSRGYTCPHIDSRQQDSSAACSAPSPLHHQEI